MFVEAVREEPEFDLFDETVREKAEKYAERLDQSIGSFPPGRRRERARRKADSFWDAIGIAKGWTKAEAVAWIQENSGGKTGATMDDVGEIGGTVWGLGTACSTLSSWRTILETVACLVDVE